MRWLSVLKLPNFLWMLLDFYWRHQGIYVAMFNRSGNTISVYSPGFKIVLQVCTGKGGCLIVGEAIQFPDIPFL